MTTIGASVLDEQQEQQNPWRGAAATASASLSGSQPPNNIHPYNHHDPQQHPRFSLEPMRPALPSLLSVVTAQQQQKQQRLLLLQPYTTSSSTTTRRDHSLAMDWAVSLASAEPCRCHRLGERPGSSCSSHGSWRSHYSSVDPDTAAAAAAAAETMDPSVNVQPIPCENCVAVTLIVPSPTTPIGAHAREPQPLDAYTNDHWFPLLCRRYEKGDNDSNFHPLTLNLNDQRRQADYQRRQQQALQRVQVRHVTTLHDVWEYLLQLPGLPADQQPVGGILLCGLDSLMEPRQQMQPHDPALTTIRLTQTVAILMDTVVCLERTFGRPPATAVTLQSPSPSSESHGSANNNNTVEAWFRAASSFWSPLVLRVVPANEDDNDGRHHHRDAKTPTTSKMLRTLRHNDPDEVAISHWIVRGGTVTGRYAVLQNLDHEERIVWQTDDHNDK